jgi:hypothetical protein
VAARAANWNGQPFAAESDGGLAEWPALYSEYLLRTAEQSARSLELYQEVMDCIARNELAPTALQDMLGTFGRARGTAYTNQLTELSMRFFGEMVRIGTAYTDELTEAMMPGSVEPPLSPPRFDPANPTAWFQQINDYASQLSTRTVRIYQALLERVAAGEVSPDRLQSASSDYLERRFPDHLRRLGNLYFDVLNSLNDLRAGYEEEFLSGVLASARPDEEAQFALNLIAPLGETATASMSLGNTRDEPASIRCAASDVRRADGVGPAFMPKLDITPDAFHLEPGEEASLTLSLRLDPDAYDPDASYVGTLYITGHGEPRLEVPLRIMATVPDESATAANTEAE